MRYDNKLEAKPHVSSTLTAYTLIMIFGSEWFGDFVLHLKNDSTVQARTHHGTFISW